MAMTTKQAAEKWGISDRRVRTLCVNGQIDGAWREGKLWFVPDNAPKPADGRIRGKETLLAQIERKKKELDGRRPLTEGEVARLNEDFMIEYTYNSNAIEGNTLTLRETDMVLKGLTIDQKPLKDHMEAVGHKDAFYFICDLVKDRTPLSESVIKQIHSLVLADKPLDRSVHQKSSHFFIFICFPHGYLLCGGFFIDQLVIDMDLSGSFAILAGTFVNGDELDQLHAHLAGQLGYFHIGFQAADEFVSVCCIITDGLRLAFQRVNRFSERFLFVLVFLKQVDTDFFGNLAQHLVLINRADQLVQLGKPAP